MQMDMSKIKRFEVLLSLKDVNTFEPNEELSSLFTAAKIIPSPMTEVTFEKLAKTKPCDFTALVSAVSYVIDSDGLTVVVKLKEMWSRNEN